MMAGYPLGLGTEVTFSHPPAPQVPPSPPPALLPLPPPPGPPDQPKWVGMLALAMLAGGIGFGIYMLVRQDEKDAKQKPKPAPEGDAGHQPNRVRRGKHRRNKGRYYAGTKTDCHGDARGGSGYLFPADKRYPVPNLKCAHRALTFAAWPNNIEDVPAVITAMKRTSYAKDAGIQERMKKLRARYDHEKRAGRVEAA